MERKPKHRFLFLRFSLSTTCRKPFKTRKFTTKTTFPDFQAILSPPKFRIFFTFLQLVLCKDTPLSPNEFGQKQRICVIHPSSPNNSPAPPWFSFPVFCACGLWVGAGKGSPCRRVLRLRLQLPPGCSSLSED